MIEVKKDTTFGWPIPTAPGKTHGKDIMLICKRWYNTDKYNNTKKALEQYYSERYQYGEKQDPLSFSFINEVMLKPVIQELLSERFRLMFIEWVFTCRIRILETRDRASVSYDEELYYRLIGFINQLRSYEDNGDLLINTDAYWLKDDQGNEVKKDGHRILAEPIIKD